MSTTKKRAVTFSGMDGHEYIVRWVPGVRLSRVQEAIVVQEVDGELSQLGAVSMMVALESIIR